MADLKPGDRVLIEGEYLRPSFHDESFCRVSVGNGEVTVVKVVDLIPLPEDARCECGKKWCGWHGDIGDGPEAEDSITVHLTQEEAEALTDPTWQPKVEIAAAQTADVKIANALAALQERPE